MTTAITTTDPSPISLIAAADMTTIDAEKLEKMMSLQERWEDRQASKAFNSALCDFQMKAPIIEKADDAHGKSYARIDRIWRAIRPLLTEMGLSVAWHTCTIVDGLCHVEGLLSHRDGHSVKLVRDVPLPELIRAQNAAQQAGSAESYGKRYAITAALGIVTGDDDDGHSCGTQFLTVEQAKEVNSLLDKLNDPTVTDSLLKWAEAETVETIPASKFRQTISSLKKKLP